MSNFKKAVSMLLALTMILSMFSVVVFADETDPTAAPADTEQVEALASDSEAVDGDPAATAGSEEVVTTTTNQEAADAVVGSAAATDLVSLPNDDVEYAADYKFDYGLGLFEMLPDGYWQTQQVTRADFATVVAKMLKANTEGYPRYGQTPYSDVDAANSAYPAICYLTEIGILVGDGDTMFRPNDPIIVSEASKMIMCALGYKNACEATNGGYPNGYTSFALREGIYNGLSISYTNSMTAMQMSRMVRNAMQAYLMDTITYTSNGGQLQVIQSSKTLLSETYKMISARGIVEGTYYSYVGDREVDLENEVVIAGVQADINNATNVDLGTVTYQYPDNLNLEEYIGYEVNFYYMEDVSGYRRNYISYCEPRNSRNTVYDIDSKYISSLTSSEIVYNDQNGRDRTINIANAAVSFNGVATSTKLTDESLVLKQGHVKIVCHDNVNSADYVIIEEQYDGLFERYNQSTYQAIFQNNMTSKMPALYFEDAYHTRMTLNGAKIEPEELQKNDVITYTVSDDGMYINAYVSRDIIENGTVTSKYVETYPSGSYDLYVINGQEYTKSQYLEKTINAGFESDFQLTYNGRIAGTNVAGSGAGNYGYLIDFAFSQATYDDCFYAKILDMNGNVRELRSVNGRVLTNISGSEPSRLNLGDRDVKNLMTQVFSSPQLVTYELNNNDEIRTIYCAPDYTSQLPDSDLFGKYYSGTFPYSNQLMQYCAITNDTVIFSVPYEDRNRDDDYSILTLEDLTEDSYTADIYDVFNGVANALVVKDVNPSSLSDTSGIMLVDEVVHAWDEENMQEVTEIIGWSGGEKISIKVDGNDYSTLPPITAMNDDRIANDDVNNLVKGDVIQYNRTAKDYLNAYKVLFNRTNRIDNGNFEVAVASSQDRNPHTEWNEDGMASSYTITANEDIRAIYAQITNAYDYFVLATCDTSDMKWSRAYPTQDAEIYIYDMQKDEIRLGESFDLQIGDKIFVKVNKGDENYVIVAYQ